MFKYKIINSLFLLSLFISNTLGTNSSNCTCDIPERYERIGEGIVVMSSLALFLAGYSLFFSWQNCKTLRHFKYRVVQTRN